MGTEGKKGKRGGGKGEEERKRGGKEGKEEERRKWE